MYSYFIPQALLPSDPSIMNANALSLMASSGTKELGASMFLTDVQLSSTCVVLGRYAFAQKPVNYNGINCVGLDSIVDFIMAQLYSLCPTTTAGYCDLKDPTILGNITSSTLTTCGATNNAAVTTAVVAALASTNLNLQDAYNDVDVLPIPVVIYGSKVSKIVQSDIVAAVASSTPSSVANIFASGWDSRVNAATVNSTAILLAMSLAPLTPASSSSGTTYSFGPVTGNNTLVFKNLLDFSVTGSLALPAYQLANGTWGIFTIPKGGMDSYLNTLQVVDLVVMAPNPSTTAWSPSTAQAQLSPGGALATAYFLYKQASDRAVYMTPDYYNAVFGMVLGANFTGYDCSARSWNTGTIQQLGAFGVDIIAGSLPNLLAQFVGGMLNGSSTTMVTSSIDDLALTVNMYVAFNLTKSPGTGSTSGRNVFFSTSDIAVMAYNLYFGALSGAAKNTSVELQEVGVQVRRKLSAQATSSDIMSISLSYAQAIATSNSYVSTLLKSVVAAMQPSTQGRRLLQSFDVTSLTTQLAGAAKVQQANIAAAGAYHQLSKLVILPGQLRRLRRPRQLSGIPRRLLLQPRRHRVPSTLLLLRRARHLPRHPPRPQAQYRILLPLRPPPLHPPLPPLPPQAHRHPPRSPLPPPALLPGHPAHLGLQLQLRNSTSWLPSRPIMQ